MAKNDRSLIKKKKKSSYNKGSNKNK